MQELKKYTKYKNECNGVKYSYLIQFKLFGIIVCSNFDHIRLCISETHTIIHKVKLVTKHIYFLMSYIIIFILL